MQYQLFIHKVNGDTIYDKKNDLFYELDIVLHVYYTYNYDNFHTQFILKYLDFLKE